MNNRGIGGVIAVYIAKNCKLMLAEIDCLNEAKQATTQDPEALKNRKTFLDKLSEIYQIENTWPIISDEYTLYIYYDTIYFGLIASQYSDQKAFSILQTICTNFENTICDGDLKSLASISRSMNREVSNRVELTPNCYTRHMSGEIYKLLEAQKTGINLGQIGRAHKYIKETKGEIGGALETQLNTKLITDELEEHAEVCLLMAEGFDKEADKFREDREKFAFWMCSNKCMIIFGSIFAIIITFVLLNKLF